MKFNWEYKYVEEGQLEPDKHGRWAITCRILAHIDNSIPEYDWSKDAFGGYLPVKIAIILQKGTSNGNVASTIHKYCACIPSFWDAGNTGFSNHCFYSNDIEELKKVVEREFEKIQSVFKNCK